MGKFFLADVIVDPIEIIAYELAELAVLVPVLLISLAMTVLTIIGTWKIFEKMGEHGWISLIPGWNLWVMFKHCYGGGPKMFLVLIPIAGEVILCILNYRLFRSFGKSAVFSVFAMLFFTPIAYLICGFGKAEFTEIYGA